MGMAEEQEWHIGREYLVGLLTAGTQSWSAGVGGGVGRITQADAAALLARIDGRLKQEVFRLIEFDDWSQAEWLERELWLRVCDWSSVEEWRVPTGEELIRRMVGMALVEWRWPRFWEKEEEKIQRLGRHKSNWYRTWRPRYERIYQFVGQQLAEAWVDVQG